MRVDDGDRTVLMVNDHVRLAGIPPEVHGYVVNGRTPIEWFIDRYHVRRDRESGIVNDPNRWFLKPEDLIAAIRQIVHVSVETARIVGSLRSRFRTIRTTAAVPGHDEAQRLRGDLDRQLPDGTAVTRPDRRGAAGHDAGVAARRAGPVCCRRFGART